MRFLAAASLLLATLLPPPIAAAAQTPLPTTSPLQKVSIQVTFVTVKTEDLDALGINFDLIPLPDSPRTFIAFAEGSIVPQRYQLLTSTAAHMGNHMIAPAPITVSDNVPAVFIVNTQVPVDAIPLPIDQGHSDFPQLIGSIQLRGKITLIPQIVPGNSVRLDMLSPIGSSQRMRFRTTPSGQQVVMYVAVVPVQVATSRRRRTLDAPELLIFVTATIVGKTVMPAPTVKPQVTAQPKPQVQFPGSAAGFSGNSFGFGTGFGLGRPSDALQSTHWLESLHWPGRSNIEGTISRPSIEIEAPPLPSGIIRIYAL